MAFFDYARGGNLYYNTKKHMVIMVRGNEKFFYEINNKRVSKSKYLKTLSQFEKSCKKVVSQPYYFL